ncbi:MAG: DUF1592 domain-containing protein, partial [Planctomycetota bacterium]
MPTHGVAADVGHLPTDSVAFVRENCVACHDGEDGDGGFDATELLGKSIAADSEALHRWVRVFDRVNDGEMPPPEDFELDTELRDRFLEETSAAIESTVQEAHRVSGRVTARRLTNRQLERSLNQLLGIRLPLARMIPEETRVDGFRNMAASQSISHYHLEDHLRVVDRALDFAWQRAADAVRSVDMDLPAERIARKRRGQRNRDPEMRQGAAVIWTSSMPFYGRISNSRIAESGWYDIALEASAVKPPSDRGIWCSLRSGECVSQSPLMYWIDSFEVTEEPQVFEFRAWLDAGHLVEIRPADNTLRKARFRGGQVGFGEGEPQDVPGIAMHSLTFRRIFPGGDVEDVREKLFGDLPIKTVRGQLRVDGKTDVEACKQAVRRFASLAFRSPPSEETIEPYLRWVDQQYAEGEDTLELLRQVYRAIMCSPRFMFFDEQPGRLSDHAVANRLSFLLTGQAPDTTLRRAADAGKLSQATELLAHTRRLMDGTHFESFIEDFADQWLDLADIDFTEPDRRMFSEFDLVVQNAFVEETRRFIGGLIQSDAPAARLVDADFTWLNGRLADFYGIDVDLQPSEWQKVSLSEHPNRGGLLTHGSVLKVTANGTNTSPVVRGVWVLERILGDPPQPPPPGIPGVEPDIRGAKTLREILDKHRDSQSCNACHQKIDPPGFALEAFNPIGGFRERFRSMGGGERIKLEIRGRKVRFRLGPEVDSAGAMPDGRSFEDFREFRDLLAANQEGLARTFV